MMLPLDKIGEAVNDVIARYWELQGHRLDPSKFIQTLEYKAEDNALNGYTEAEYARYINQGVPAAAIRHPFAPARIAGLTLYAERRMGLSGREAVSVAYAIATKHASEGMPLPSTSKFSRNGKRTHFLDNAFEKLTFEQTIEQIIDEAVTESVDKSIQVKI